MSGLGVAAGVDFYSRGMDLFQNMVQGRINQIYNYDYMDRYGSLGAQFQDLRDQGVNPYGINSGVGQPVTPPTMTGMGAPNNTLPDLMNTTLNPTMQRNVESQSDKNEAEAKGQEIKNDVDEASKAADIKKRIADSDYSEEKKKELQFIVEHQPEAFSMSQSALNAQKIKHLAEADEAREHIKEMDEAIKNLEAQRREIEANITYLNSAAEAASARAALDRVNKEIADIKKQRDNVELQRYERSGEVPEMIRMYDETYDKKLKELESKYGKSEWCHKEARRWADKWWNEKVDEIGKIAAAESHGTAVGEAGYKGWFADIVQTIRQVMNSDPDQWVGTDIFDLLDILGDVPVEFWNDMQEDEKKKYILERADEMKSSRDKRHGKK